MQSDGGAADETSSPPSYEEAVEPQWHAEDPTSAPGVPSLMVPQIQVEVKSAAAAGSAGGALEPDG